LSKKFKLPRFLALKAFESEPKLATLNTLVIWDITPIVRRVARKAMDKSLMMVRRMVKPR
jgi:hypothetical protein